MTRLLLALLMIAQLVARVPGEAERAFGSAASEPCCCTVEAMAPADCPSCDEHEEEGDEAPLLGDDCCPCDTLGTTGPFIAPPASLVLPGPGATAIAAEPERVVRSRASPPRPRPPRPSR